MPADYRDIRVSTRLNGETVQEATARDMIFSVPEQIAYIPPSPRSCPAM